jgi:hypothetical protein
MGEHRRPRYCAYNYIYLDFPGIAEQRSSCYAGGVPTPGVNFRFSLLVLYVFIFPTFFVSAAQLLSASQVAILTILFSLREVTHP